MVVKCEEVWREVSNYLDGETSPELRAAIEEHVRGCKRCTAVVDGTRNVIHLYADGKKKTRVLLTDMAELPRKEIRVGG